MCRSNESDVDHEAELVSLQRNDHALAKLPPKGRHARRTSRATRVVSRHPLPGGLVPAVCCLVVLRLVAPPPFAPILVNMSRMIRPPYVDPQTNIVYDTDNPDFQGWLTKQSMWLRVSCFVWMPVWKICFQNNNISLFTTGLAPPLLFAQGLQAVFLQDGLFGATWHG